MTMSNYNPAGIPHSTIMRVPLYLKLLKSIRQQNRSFISSNNIAGKLGLDADLVRNDFIALQIPTGDDTIHETNNLIKELEVINGEENYKEAFLLGINSTAINVLNDKIFSDGFVKVIALFDSNPVAVSKLIEGEKVYELIDLAGLAKRLHIINAIITSDAADAQNYADVLVDAGIEVIWNFSGVLLTVPLPIMVNNLEKHYES